MRIGNRYNAQCVQLILNGEVLKFVSELKYLCVYLVAGKYFRTTIDHLKVKFFRVFNCIFAHSKAANSEIVSLELLNAYCLPFLLYATESVSPSVSHMQSMNNCINMAVCKIFRARTADCVTADCVKDISHFVGLQDVATLVEGRRMKFVDNLIHRGRYMLICFYLSDIANWIVSSCSCSLVV